MPRRIHGTALLVVATFAACSSRPDPVGGSPEDARPGDGGSTETDTGSAGDAGGTSTDFAFVANYVSGIAAFAIQPGGELVALHDAPFAPQVHFYGVAVHPSRPLLYAAEYTGHAVHAYQIDPDTGALAPVGQPVAIDHPAISIAVDPLGRFVYVGDFDDASFTDHAIHTFAIDPTGALAPDPVASLPRPHEASVIAPDPSGHFVYTTDADLGARAYAVDATGALSELTGSPFAATTVRGGWLAFHPTAGILYNARQALEGLAIDPTSGALQSIPFGGGANADPGEIALAVDPRGRFVCVVDMPAGTVTVYATHADGTLAVPGSSYDAGTFAYSVAIDPDGRFVYVATDFGNVAAFSVDPTSLVLTPLAQSPFLSVVGNAPEMIVYRASPAATPPAST